MLELATDRRPPQNLDAERQVLSACLLDPGVLDDAMLVLRREDFYRDAHALLWSVLVDLRSAGRPVDCVTVADELERAGRFERFGGDDALGDIANAAPHAANALFHAELVRQKSQVRKLLQAASEVIRDGYSNLHTASELIESAESRIFAVRDEGLERATVDASTLVGETVVAIESRRLGASQGLSTGFGALDQFLELRPSELVILAARPSIGKTSLAASMAEHAALSESVRVLFVSLEMDRGSLMERMIASRSGVDGGRLRRAWLLDEGELLAMRKAADVLDRALIEFADAPKQSVSEIAAMGRRMKHRGGLGLVVVDYLGLIATSGGKGKTRQDEVAEVSRSLKAAARELKTPFLVLCQLNRESEKREDRRPRLADLRESGQIEQDADAVLLLHRPEFYDPEDQPGVAEVAVAKNRNGATGSARLKFVKQCTRFEDLPPGWGGPAPAF